jgi:tRNA:m4X modification enzyme
LADSKGRVDTPACRRQAFAVNLGPVALNNLISRLDTVSKHINEHSPDTFSILGEEELEKLAATASSGESHLPFNNKHGAQHASLIGNMSTFGLFKHPKDTMFIEFGAGKGYLTNALAALVSGADHLVMMDNQKFKLLADRGLRDKKMQRVRCDIANFEPSGLVGFEKSLYSVAFGKHLCGAATDLTLRCCLRSLLKEKEKMNMKDKEDKEETVTGRGSSTSEEEDRNSLEEELQVQPASTLNSLLGLGVATCCHHRCTWQHYVAQDVILELGFTPEEFEMISHFTSWALCGHGASNSKISRERKSGTEGTTEGVSNSAGNGGGGAAAAADGNGNGNGVKDKDEVAMNEEEEINEEENLNEQGNGGGWRLHHSFSREQRQLIGRQCKRLIDYGRVEWLRRNGFEAIEVLYCDPESSGENRLVLAKPN